MITFAVDDTKAIARLDAMPAMVHASLLRKVYALSLQLEAKAKGNAPVGKNSVAHTAGQLRRSIFSGVEDSSTSVIGKVQSGADTPYAKYVEYGTSAHDIVPTKAKALAFMMDGKQVFAKIVHHPGTRAQYFMRNSLQEMTPTIEVGLREAVVQGLRV